MSTAIKVPGARGVGERSKKKKVDAHVALVPFIDFLLCVVLFLLMSFSATGEMTVSADLPDADHGTTIETAPIIAIDANQVTIDGRRVADTRALLANSNLERIDPLVRDLEIQAANWPLLHPTDEFTGHVIVQADRDVDFRAIRKVLFSVAQAGYGGTQLAVRQR